MVNLKRTGVLEHTKKSVAFFERVGSLLVAFTFVTRAYTHATAMYTTPENVSIANRAFQDVRKAVFKHIINVTEHTAATSLKKLIVRYTSRDLCILNSTHSCSYENFHFLANHVVQQNDQLSFISNEAKKSMNDVRSFCGQLDSALTPADPFTHPLGAHEIPLWISERAAGQFVSSLSY